MNLKKNILLYYAISFFNACLFMIPIRYFFFVNYLNFWIGEAILINTLSWLVSMFFEVHSWWWADRFWRKKLYIIWLLSVIFCFSFYLWATSFYLFVISSFFMWFWYALTSWNLEALIHDNLEEKWLEKEYDKIQSNSYIIMFSWRAISSLIAWYLFFYNPLYPFSATIICYAISLILIFFIHSPKQELSDEKGDTKHLKKAFVFLLENKNLLFVIVFLGFIFSWIWNIYWFTYQPYLENIWIKIKDIWIIYFFISAFSAFWSYIIKKLQSKLNIFTILTSMFVCLLIVSLMFSYFDNLFWILPILILCILFWFVMTIGNSYLIKYSPKTHKSTILSIFSLAGSIWYFAFWVTSGYIAQIFSLKILYNILPLLVFTVLLAYIFFFRQLWIKNKFY